MKKFINKISRGSLLALFKKILLLVQVLVIINTYVNRPECNDDHDYQGFITEGGENYD